MANGGIGRQPQAAAQVAAAGAGGGHRASSSFRTARHIASSIPGADDVVVEKPRGHSDAAARDSECAIRAENTSPLAESRLWRHYKAGVCRRRQCCGATDRNGPRQCSRHGLPADADSLDAPCTELAQGFRQVAQNPAVHGRRSLRQEYYKIEVEYRFQAAPRGLRQKRGCCKKKCVRVRMFFVWQSGKVARMASRIYPIADRPAQNVSQRDRRERKEGGQSRKGKSR